VTFQNFGPIKLAFQFENQKIPKMDENYKLLKEAALTNVNGGTVLETAVLSMLMPLCAILHYIFIEEKRHSWTHLAKEYFCWFFPYIITFSYLCDMLPLATFVTLGSIFLYAYMTPSRFPFLNELKLKEFNSKRKPFITVYRVVVMMGVSVSILMVDFPNIFPLRLNKCKDFGISVMDAGVGTFIFSSGLTAQVGERSIKSIMKSFLPTILIGLARSVSIHMTNYQQIVTEYGVHWNFFFTIASVSLFVNILGQTTWNFTLGIFFALLHQFLLYYGLQSYILGPIRDSFIDQNKEGICTLLGYISIYYIACGFGGILKKEKTKEEWKRFMIYLWLITFALLAVSQIFLVYFSISRRLVNIGYIIAVLGLNGVIFNGVLTIAMFTPVHEALYVEIVNSNPLYFFLIANLLTGLVNFTVNTLTTPKIVSFGIVCIFAIGVSVLRWLTIKIT
jgi:phosphatidylinositol glycan class W